MAIARAGSSRSKCSSGSEGRSTSVAISRAGSKRSCCFKRERFPELSVRGSLQNPPMIACRTVGCFHKATHTKQTLQEGYSFHGLMTLSKQLLAEDYSSSMDWNKKRKSVIPVWRPVSTLSSLNAAACSSSVLSVNDESKAAEEGSDLLAAKHSISVEVGASLMRFIKGKGGGMQKSIEEEMGVKIIFPSHRNTDSIVIEGDSAKSITNASDKIQSVISEAVQSPNLDYSHFISLPLAIHPELVDKLFRFQNSILGNNSPEEDREENADVGSDEDASEDIKKNLLSEKAPAVEVKLNVEDGSNHVKVDIKNIPLTSYQSKPSKTETLSDLGIDKSIFIKPKTFHLTVLMLKLWNRERVHAAKEVLQSISTKVMDVLDGRPLTVRLKGLDCMRGSLSKARVLYAPVEVGNEDRLVRACQVIIDAYTEAGLVLEKDARHKLKLHATLMNARHRRRKMGNKRMDSFDARCIFKEYGSEEWGEYHIREAHLSQRFVFDNSGYYHCCAALPFPTSTLVE